MEKADYSKIASFYDRAHTMRDENLKLWRNMVSERINPGTDTQLLDLGCGTGKFSLIFAADLGVKVTAADASPAMLEKAVEKDTAGVIKWGLQNAERLTFADETFDAVFMSHLLHHLDSPLTALRGCKRVLKRSGAVLIRYGAIEQIREDYRHVFFPETLEIDEPRTPSVAMVENWLEQAGFSRVESEEVKQITFEDSGEVLKATQHRITSVLSMIPESVFETGLKKLAEYITANPEDPWLFENKMTLTVGYKS